MKDTVYHPAPEWLTEEYMQNVLRDYKQVPDLQILELILQPATAKGENYASVMTRIKVKYQLSSSHAIHEGSYIAKTSFEGNTYIAGIFNPYKPFTTEMIMYEKILPQLQAVLQEIDDKTKIFADTIFVDYERTAIFFEDLAVKNFTIGDRLKGYNLAHVKFALQNLAKMHAAAAVYNERMPGVLTKFDHGIFNRHTKGFGPYFENFIEVAAQYAGECPELGEYYKAKLLKLKSHVVEKATCIYDAEPNFFHTLVHGDYWINNIMLRYHNDERNNSVGTLKELILIDLQFSCWASPAVDLHYLFNTSLEPELRLKHQAELFQYYHQLLTQHLKALKFAGHIPTLHEFILQKEAKRFYAVTSALVVQPVMTSVINEDIDFSILLLDDEPSRRFRRRLYDNKHVQTYVKALLPVFDRKGLLDVIE